jgi:hypothetical protein
VEREVTPSRLRSGDFTMPVSLEDAVGISWELALLQIRTRRGRKQKFPWRTYRQFQSFVSLKVKYSSSDTCIWKKFEGALRPPPV